MPFVLKGTRERERAPVGPPHSPRGNLNYAPSPSLLPHAHPPANPANRGRPGDPPLSTPPAHPSHASVSKGRRLRHNTVQEGEERRHVRSYSHHLHAHKGGRARANLRKQGIRRQADGGLERRAACWEEEGAYVLYPLPLPWASVGGRGSGIEIFRVARAKEEDKKGGFSSEPPSHSLPRVLFLDLMTRKSPLTGGQGGRGPVGQYIERKYCPHSPDEHDVE